MRPNHLNAIFFYGKLVYLVFDQLLYVTRVCSTLVTTGNKRGNKFNYFSLNIYG
mgnify:CR=1 FL=1